jgi:hypothetical protein
VALGNIVLEKTVKVAEDRNRTECEEEEAMNCPRCRGLLVLDTFYDLLDDTGHLSFNAWRCVCCGNVLDPLILRNQQVGMKL